ncbi:MAG: hypothetical protein ACR2FH_02135 [Caulobacteraceae bacterium]
MIYLHIGRAKTGTTALQAFLGRNRRRLADAGLQFPRTLMRGRAQHDLALALTPSRMRRMTGEARSKASAELEQAKRLVAAGRDLIISSEMFQRAEPHLVAEIFPPGQTKVIVYIREQLDALISAYAQRIQGTMELATFVEFAGRFDANYLEFLDGWADAFGADRLIVGIYDRACLLNGDIRADFLAHLPVDPAPLNFERGKSQQGNPTIGAAPIEFKGVLNALVPEDVQRRLLIFDNLAAITTKFPRLRTSHAFAEIFRCRFAASNKIVQRRYLGYRAFPKHTVSGPPSAVGRDEAIDLSMAALGEIAPETASRVADYLKPDDIANLHPLLPADWREAEEELEHRLEHRMSAMG